MWMLELFKMIFIFTVAHCPVHTLWPVVLCQHTISRIQTKTFVPFLRTGFLAVWGFILGSLGFVAAGREVLQLSPKFPITGPPTLGILLPNSTLWWSVKSL